MNALIWILSSAVLILAVLLIRALFGRKLRPGLRYGLWALVLVRLLVPWNLWTAPVSVEAPVSRTELGQDLDLLREVDAVTRSPEGDVSGAPSRPVLGDEAPERPVIIARDVTPERFERLRSTLTLRKAAEAVWAAGSAAMLVLLTGTNVRLYVNLRRRRKRLAADAPARVYEVEGLESSCLFLNAIYVNAETAADPLKLRHVLAHELSHRRHLDGLWTLLRCAALTVHWFDPLVWLAAAKSREDSELFADAGALSRLGEEERQAYGETLISLSVHARRAVSPLCAATSMGAGKRALRARVELIARRPRATAAAVLAVVLIAGIAVGCTFAGSASGKDGAVENNGPDPGQTTPNEEGDPPSDNRPSDNPPSDNRPGELPQTTELAVYKSAALGVEILYPAEWNDLITLSEGTVPEYFFYFSDDIVSFPCVRIDLREDVFGVPPTETTDDGFVADNAVGYIFKYISGFGPTPERDYGNAAGVTEYLVEYSNGDFDNFRCFLPMNTKLNWTGVDAGPDAQRIYDAYDTIERGVLANDELDRIEPKLTVRPLEAFSDLSALSYPDLFGLYDRTDGAYAELYVDELISRFLREPAAFLSALAEEPQEARSFLADTLGADMCSWYPQEARECFGGLAGETLDPRQTELLDAVISAFDAYDDANSPADLADLGFEEPYLDRPAGITMELLYEGEDSIIFFGETGVWGYDLREERITFGIDLLKVFNNMVYFQGEGDPYSVYVRASADGKELILSCGYRGTTDPERERETYYVDVPTLTYRKGEYRILNDPFNFEDAVGTIIPGIYVGEAVYIRGDKTYELFK